MKPTVAGGRASVHEGLLRHIGRPTSFDCPVCSYRANYTISTFPGSQNSEFKVYGCTRESAWVRQENRTVALCEVHSCDPEKCIRAVLRCAFVRFDMCTGAFDMIPEAAEYNICTYGLWLLL